MSSLLYLVLLVLWSTECSSLTIAPSTNTITREGIKDFSLTCSNEDSDGRRKINKMRILKLKNHTWTPLAEMDCDWQSPKTLDGLEVSVTGSDVNSLKMTWALATEETETGGQYMCDITGYDQSEDGVSLRSESIHIDVEHELRKVSLYQMVEADRQQIETYLGDMSTYKEMFSESERVQLELTGAYFQQWPEGLYALMKPRSGCPEDASVRWKSAFRRHHTESQLVNKDSISTPFHLAVLQNGTMETLYEKNGQKFMYQHYCFASGVSYQRLWPRGSYCIMTYYKDGMCPTGFQEGSIYWDDENTNNQNERTEQDPLGSMDNTEKDTLIRYCCRNDSSPLSPIFLPTAKPFYLHRYGGTCQEVAGMKVTPEYMLFHTECCDSRFEGFAPDGASSLPMVKLELCYYVQE